MPTSGPQILLKGLGLCEAADGSQILESSWRPYDIHLYILCVYVYMYIKYIYVYIYMYTYSEDETMSFASARVHIGPWRNLNLYWNGSQSHDLLMLSSWVVCLLVSLREARYRRNITASSRFSHIVHPRIHRFFLQGLATLQRDLSTAKWCLESLGNTLGKQSRGR